MDNATITLFQAQVGLKKAASDKQGEWNIYGIASSEGIDQDGERILRESLDNSYLRKRGYINWNHSKEPGDQLGYTTKAEIIMPGMIDKYQDMLGINISKKSSLYIEGILYNGATKSAEVKNILESVPKSAGAGSSLGLSVEGVMTKQWNKPNSYRVVLSDLPVLVNGMFLLKVSADNQSETFKLSKSN